MEGGKLATGREFKRVRTLAGLTVSEVARITNVSRTTVYSLESGSDVKEETIVQMVSKLLTQGRCRDVSTDLEAILSEYKHRELGRNTNASVADLVRIAKQHMQTDTLHSISEYREMIAICQSLIRSFNTRIEERARIERDPGWDTE